MIGGKGSFALLLLFRTTEVVSVVLKTWPSLFSEFGDSVPGARSPDWTTLSHVEKLRAVWHRK